MPKFNFKSYRKRKPYLYLQMWLALRRPLFHLWLPHSPLETYLTLPPGLSKINFCHFFLAFVQN